MTTIPSQSENCKNLNITIKPADKGDSIVIMNTTDYVKEAQRQFSNPQHYKTLDKDSKTPYNKYIHHLIDQACRLGIVDETTKQNLQRTQKLLHFIFYPKNISSIIQADL